MKVPQNGSDSYMTGSATPNGLIDTPEVKESWARYISKFISAYHRKGVPIWAITPQNEPEFPAPWEACAYNASFERGFIDGYLGPIVKQDHPDMLVLAFDHNKDHLAMWSEENIGSEYVDGMAFHWYTGSVDRLLDGTYGYDSVNKSHHMAPEKLLVATEGCSCPDVRLGDILRAERLAHDVMFDLNAFANGWIDWNLLVDHKGGFNHLGNNCDAPIVTTSDFSNIIVQPKYFYMGHFSKFISPGSKRVASQVRGSYRFAKMDPNVRDGMELGLFPCEQSVRQMWTYTENNTVALSMPVIDTEKPDDAPKGLCIGPGNKDRPFIHLAACDSQWAYQFDMMENGQMMELDSGKCLSVVGGVTEPGALFELSACEAGRDAEDATPSQYFYLDVTQELQTPLIEYSIAAETDALCVTAGWPFLTAAAFVNTKQETVLVVMNEASIDTEIVLSDVVKGDAWFGINARSIQTVIY
jgi:glucosylceramidase